MKTTRFWLEGDKLVTKQGRLKECGSFEYQGAFGSCTRYVGYSFATKEDAVNDALETIENTVKVLNERKMRLLGELNQ